MSMSIANRLGLIERKVDFIMNAIRTKAVKPGAGGVLGADGRPVLRSEDVIDVTLAQVFEEVEQVKGFVRVEEDNSGAAR